MNRKTLKNYFAIIVLMFVTHASNSKVIFQKHTSEGGCFRLETEPMPSSEGPVSESAHYMLFETKNSDHGGKVLWQRSAPSSGGFQMLDLTKETSGLYLCYKLGKVTFVEHANTTESPVKVNSDSFGLGLVSTSAVFGQSNGVLILRLGFKNYQVRAFAQEGGGWLRSAQYDLKVPLWARDIKLSNPNIIGGPILQTFPSADYPEASWGEAQQGIQLGLRFKSNSYRSGEPIIATVHLRNNSSEAIHYEVNKMSSENSPVEFSIKNHQNGAVPCKCLEMAPFIPVQKKTLDSGMQSLHPFYLDKLFFLRPGSYIISLHIKVPGLSNASELSLVSGSVKIEILP